MHKNGVTFIISLIVLSIVVLNIWGNGLDNADQILREIVMILAGAFGNAALNNMRNDKDADDNLRDEDSDSNGS